MIRVTGEKQKSEIAYAIQKYNKSTIYSYGDFCPIYLDTYITYDTECDPISFCKFVIEDLKEKVRDNEGLPIPMIVIYTNLDDLVKITVIENYIKEIENETDRQSTYSSNWIYDGNSYTIAGKIELKELKKILKEMKV